MHLLMAVEECQAGIICDQVYFELRVGLNNYDVLKYSGHLGAFDVRQLKSVPVQVQRMRLIAAVIE